MDMCNFHQLSQQNLQNIRTTSLCSLNHFKNSSPIFLPTVIVITGKMLDGEGHLVPNLADPPRMKHIILH